jgi:pSer/pThr/pTyr-binding forkhead associated (FHA) protein
MITSTPDASATAKSPSRWFEWNPFEPVEPELEPALIAHGPSGERRRIALPFGWRKIGSSDSAEIQLEHPEVSRVHARLIRDRDELLHVIDDRSLSGVFVNGTRVRWAELSDGDELTIGPFRLIVLTGAPAPHAII